MQPQHVLYISYLSYLLAVFLLLWLEVFDQLPKNKETTNIFTVNIKHIIHYSSPIVLLCCWLGNKRAAVT